MNARNDERESIARYFEHLAECRMGTLVDAFNARETLRFAASWVRNRLDEKHHAEVAENTPPRPTSARSTTDE